MDTCFVVTVAIVMLLRNLGLILRYLWQLVFLSAFCKCSSSCFFFLKVGGSSTQAWMPTYVSILRIPQMIRVWRATAEWYIDRGEKPVPVPLCPPQIPHGLTRARTRVSAVRDRRLTTWAMARLSWWVSSACKHPITPGTSPCCRQRQYGRSGSQCTPYSVR
jgi:hypothetical protein